jgi:superfamily II DNA or RNA helicase
MTHPGNSDVCISFDMGTLLVEPFGHVLPDDERLGLIFDYRINGLRAEASRYRYLVEALVEHDVPYKDLARNYARLENLAPKAPFQPYPHQERALAAWVQGGMAGVVVMPTGSGKTYMAQMAMVECRRSTLVVVPTLDLLAQWVRSLGACFDQEIGMVGGGEFSVQPITVITYDSAVRHVENLGDRFGLVIFDECHHLPGPVYANIARMCIAPFRLGLTATPGRADGGEEMLDELIGPVLFSSRVSALAGNVLAPYRTERILVDLLADEQTRYKEAREQYLGFCRKEGIKMSSAMAFGVFLQRTTRSREGRAAFEAYLTQKNLPLNSEAKFRVLSDLLRRHKGDRIIIFTHVNELAYRISRRYLMPLITHQTAPRERVEILDRFSKGIYPAVVTSKVLNEGVDVPEASVGIIMSGSGSIREHVQRLGRILRRREGKQACLYEVIARGTHEQSMSYRRTRHEAYRKRHAQD